MKAIVKMYIDNCLSRPNCCGGNRPTCFIHSLTNSVTMMDQNSKRGGKTSQKKEKKKGSSAS